MYNTMKILFNHGWLNGLIPNQGNCALILYNATSIPSHCGVVMLLQHKKGHDIQDYYLLLNHHPPPIYYYLPLLPLIIIKKTKKKIRRRRKDNNKKATPVHGRPKFFSADRCTLSFALHALLETR